MLSLLAMRKLMLTLPDLSKVARTIFMYHRCLFEDMGMK